YREEGQGLRIGGDWSAVTTLIVINVAVFLVGMFTPIVNPITDTNWIQENLKLNADLFSRPWNVWQLLTYGFVHGDIWHIAFNMFALFVFGRDVEGVYGRKEFFKLYLSLIILSGITFVVTQTLLGRPQGSIG